MPAPKAWACHPAEAGIESANSVMHPGGMGSMTLYAGYIQNSDASMWGSSWNWPLTIGPTRLRSGLGFGARIR